MSSKLKRVSAIQYREIRYCTSECREDDVRKMTAPNDWIVLHGGPCIKPYKFMESLLLITLGLRAPARLEGCSKIT